MERKVIGIGRQDFASLREQDLFYIDKTDLIREWWETQDDITLITRPRRFGKTLNLSMLNCFFSQKYADRADLFEGLSIWKEEKYRKLQGTCPVIFLSFADVKQDNYQDAVWKIKKIISVLYQQFSEVISWEGFSAQQRKQFQQITPDMSDVMAQSALQDLCGYLSAYYQKKVLIFLDEYDTPLQEAYLHGYWDKLAAFTRGMFNSTFKTNPCLERAIMTGITRVSKESIFSDLNNLSVITTTSERYAEYFGFTETEVFEALEAFQMEDQKEAVRRWYDGFTFGSREDMYNPWSILNFLKEKQLRPYWASTSSNGMINKMLQISSAEVKMQMEDLMQGKSIEVTFDEQIVFEQLEKKKNAIWSLLLASGYLKVDRLEYRGMMMEPWYRLRITNLETTSMFSNLFREWFETATSNYNAFVEALLKGNLRDMNAYMNDVALSTFSSFDTGNHPSGRTQPERFYHGFVLGLLVELRDCYEIKSNRESGYGRYDVMMIPKENHQNAIVMEFKVQDGEEEKTLQDTVKAALKQIEEKKYDTELQERGIAKEKIRHYGFAFEGKKVLIGSES